MTQCVCGSHNTDVVIVWQEYEYRGYVQTIELSGTECWDCGLEFLTPKQIATNAWQKFEAEFTIEQWILDEEGE